MGIINGKVNLKIFGKFSFGNDLILNGNGIDYPPPYLYMLLKERN